MATPTELTPAEAPRLRVLHAIHDFLPRHRAGSEIYAHQLCRALAPHADATVVCAEYDATAAHGDLRWREHEGVRVAEIVNNWVTRAFEDTYRSPVITERLAQVLDTVRPDVLHVHSLFNLSFDLPALAHARGIPVAATMHDYTAICASGGQRVHRAESHRCEVIDSSRCARCFMQSPWHRQMAVASAAPRPGIVRSAGQAVRRALPRLADAIGGVVQRRAATPVTEADLAERLARGHRALQSLDIVIVPSASMADDLRRLGAQLSQLSVSDYGFAGQMTPPRRNRRGPLRLGFVGTPVWHKGVHVIVDALRELEGQGVTLDVYGNLDVDPAYVSSTQRAARGLPVRWRGPFERLALADVYGAFDVLVVPSIWPENSPLVIHEAFMAGVPVVASRTGGIPELVHEGRNGWLFPPGDANALADVLRRVAREPRLVDEAARHAPAVKDIAEDAADWVARYLALVAARDVAR